MTGITTTSAVATTSTEIRPSVSAKTTEPTKTSSTTSATATTTEEIFEEAAETAASRTEITEIEALKRIAATSTTAEASKSTASLFISLRILPLFAILIIFSALIWIGDDIIGFIQSLEFCLRLRIVRMQVGMELLCAFTRSRKLYYLIDVKIKK